MDIPLRGELWDNDSTDILRWWGWRDITAPMDVAQALEQADGEEVTLLINSPGGSMAVGNEIRSMLRRYPGRTRALFQGYGASAATLAAAGCREIQSEPGALLCYHNPIGEQDGDYRDMELAAEGLKNARDCVLEVYTARKGCKPREDLMELMDKDIWISPTQALEYGLIDGIVPLEGEEPPGPGTMLAAAGRQIRLTTAMRQQYREHVAALRAAEQDKAVCAQALARVLAEM
ncbi:MAG: Clp protease ClpP [Intestinimonas sp.]|uniref:Clp protease ClpP n=1 Tax=Intestinimonas sp. TaxID=1965293 RepID=UPI002A90F946|nr:Clp protease ClpP [Intestinimonas sp.]MDY5337945.1 Clp protease ClpP [Intestinimonas sp.]